MPLPLPLTPDDALSRVIRPALELLPSTMGGESAELTLLAIGLQESELSSRVDVDGSARGLWRFGLDSGVHVVMTNPETRDAARRVLAARGCPATERSAWLALGGDDVIAACFARLLLYASASPVSSDIDVDGAWRDYIHSWQPAHPHAIRWTGNYMLALQAVTPESGA